MTSRRVPIVCPYCGYNNQVLMALVSAGGDTRIVTCDLDDGGCDSKFIADCKTHVTATARKIEGEGPSPEDLAELEADREIAKKAAAEPACRFCGMDGYGEACPGCQDVDARDIDANPKVAPAPTDVVLYLFCDTCKLPDRVFSPTGKVAHCYACSSTNLREITKEEFETIQARRRS